jgi:lipopolysaccharide transport system permease protein
MLNNLVAFVVQMVMFFGFMLYFYLKGSAIEPNISILLTPLLVIESLMLATGVGMIISAMTIKYRDLMLFVNSGIQLWMYATPIVYPLSQIPKKWQWVSMLNPMTGVTEGFRYAFLGAGSTEPLMFAMGAGITLVLTIIGMIMFGRAENTFTDTV